jgi:hypothetical protein
LRFDPCRSLLLSRLIGAAPTCRLRHRPVSVPVTYAIDMA